MKTLSVKKQLSLAFGALSAVVLGVSLLSLHDLGDANDRFSGYVRGPAEREVLANDVLDFASQRAIGVRDMVLVKTDTERASAKAMAVTGHEGLQKSLKALNGAVAGAADSSESDRALLATITQVESRYGPIALAIVELAAAGQNDQAIQKMNEECRPLLAELLAATKKYVDLSKEEAHTSVAQSAAAYQAQRLLLLSISAL